jgi:hypothetical protein
MPSTSKGLPYPSGSDVPDIVSDFQALAEAVDSELDDYSTTGHNHGSDYVSPNVLNAKGDLITATADNTLSILARGATDGHVLTIDTNESTGLKWAAAPGASGSGIEPTIIDAKGDLIVGQAADTPVRLAVGTNGHFLRVNSAATNGVEWASVPTSGDVVGPSSATNNALARFDSTTGKLIKNSTVTVSDTGDISANGATFTGVVSLASDPTQALHAATKQYVDAAAQGLTTRPAVAVATTANVSATYDNGTSGVGSTLTISPTTTLNIDGKTSWVQFDSVLFKNQTNKVQNGRFVLTTVGDSETPWVFTRCSLCDEPSEIPGSYMFVISGTANANTGWVLNVANPSTFVVGVDNIDVYQFSGAGTFSAGTGLTLTGTTFSIDTSVVTLSGTQTLTNKTISGGTVNATTLQQSGVEVVTTTGTQTITNKTLSSPTINTATINSSNLRLAGVDQKTSNYTLVASDANKLINVNSSSNLIITVPSGIFSVGDVIYLTRSGTGAVTITASGTTITSPESKLSLRVQYSSAAIICTSSNAFRIVGDLSV